MGAYLKRLLERCAAAQAPVSAAWCCAQGSDANLPGAAQDAFANIGMSMLTMVNMLAGNIDLTMFNGARPLPWPRHPPRARRRTLAFALAQRSI